MTCHARSAQGNRCAREVEHVGCHEVYVEGDGRRWYGDARTASTREAATDAFADSAAMQGNEPHFDRVLTEHEEAVRAIARSDALSDVVEWLVTDAPLDRIMRLVHLDNRHGTTEAKAFIEREFGGGAPDDSCEDCGGTGERILNPDWPSGSEPYSEKCSTCGGAG